MRYSHLAVLGLLLAPLSQAATVEPIAEPEPAAESQPVEVITVEGRKENPLPYGATKSNAPLNKTPQAISVIDSEQLELRGADSINEALRYSAGVTPESRGGVVSRYDMFTVRGFASNRNYLDGLQLMYNGWYSVAQIDTIALDRVELIKGPASVLYGNAAPGGLVNMVSKMPQTASAGAFGVAVGSNNLKEASLDLTGRVATSDDLSYRLIALGRDRDGQAVTTEEQRYLLAPSLTWAVSDDTRITLQSYLQRDPAAGGYGAAPALGSVRSNPLGELDSDFYDGDVNFETFDRRQASVGYLLEHDLSSNWTVRQNLRYLDLDVDYESIYSSGLQADNRTLNRASIYSYEQSQAYTLDNQLAGTFATAAVDHNLLIGLDYQNLDSDLDIGYGSAPTLDIFNPDNNQGRPTIPQFYDLNIAQKQTGLYLQDQLSYDNWVLLLGLRHDWYRQDSRYRNSGTTTAIDQNHTSGRAGLLYAFASGWSPYLSYSQSFEPQSGQSVSGEAFDPTTGQQWELGLKYEAPSDGLNATLALFDLTKQNVSTADPEHPGFSIQAAEIVSKGVEFEANAELTRDLELQLAYSYLDMEYRKDNNGLNGNTPTWVADQTASAWLSYGLPEQWLPGVTLGGGVRYVGETYVDAANSDKVPAYTLVDASIAYDLNGLNAAINRMSLVVSANNLFDKRHVAGCYSGDWCWFGAERSIEVGLKAYW